MATELTEHECMGLMFLLEWLSTKNLYYVEKGDIIIKFESGNPEKMVEYYKKLSTMHTEKYRERFKNEKVIKEKVMRCDIEGCGEIDDSNTAYCITHQRSPHNYVEKNTFEVTEEEVKNG